MEKQLHLVCILQASSSLVIHIGNVPWFLSHPYVQIPHRIHSTSRFSTMGLQAILKPGWSNRASDINYSWSKKKKNSISRECGKQQRTGLGAWVLQLNCSSCCCLNTFCAKLLSILTLYITGWATLAVRGIVINYESSVLLIKSFFLLLFFNSFQLVFTPHPVEVKWFSQILNETTGCSLLALFICTLF